MNNAFRIAENRARLLPPTRFSETYIEDHLQEWVHYCPSMINDGQALLSLGREVVTTEGHYIDNLAMDVTGTLVAAELKRGKTPRDVVAQLLDYAAFVQDLTVDDLNSLSLRWQEKPLAKAFEDKFGSPLLDKSPGDHRLIILAEKIDTKIEKACRYLLGQGVDVVCLQFQYRQLGAEELIDISTILGEIPDQSCPKGDSAMDPEMAACSRALIAIRDLASSRLASLEIGPAKALPKLTTSFSRIDWPEQHWTRCLYIGRRSTSSLFEIGFMFQTALFPDLRAHLEAELPDQSEFESSWQQASKTTYLVAFADDPQDVTAEPFIDLRAKELVMFAEAIVPMLNRYFQTYAPTEFTGEPPVDP